MFNPGGKQAHTDTKRDGNEKDQKRPDSLRTHTTSTPFLPSEFSGSSSGRTPPFQWSAGSTATSLVLFCDVSKTAKVSY